MTMPRSRMDTLGVDFVTIEERFQPGYGEVMLTAIGWIKAREFSALWTNQCPPGHFLHRVPFGGVALHDL
jgi:hypothetical protein